MSRTPPNAVEQGSAASAPRVRMREGSEVFLAPFFILVLWLLCVLVGSVGLAVPYSRPAPPQKEPPPVQAEILNVELTADPISPPENQPVSQLSEPPALIEIPTLQPPVAMIAVAEPSPAISFALPVEGPTRVVDAKDASYARAKPTESVPVPVAATQLTFGQGEGKQLAPDYPRRARNEGQEGTVLVRFTVGENGRVLTAEVASPCPWPLLNESALRTVREQWRFPAGKVRYHVVPIRFQLAK